MRDVKSPRFALFVVVCIAAQFVPLLNVLGYEFTALVGALLSLLGTFEVVAMSGPLRAEAGPSRWMIARRGARRLLVWVAIATGLSLLNALRVRNCAPDVGLAYALVFGVGAIPMAVATGIVAAHARTRWRRIGLVCGLLFLSFASTLATLALQPAIVAYDTYFGYYAGSIYDESLVGFGAHVLFRVWNLAWALVAVALCELARRPVRRDVLLVAGLIPLLIAGHALRGPLGLDRTRSYVIDALGGHYAGEDFDIYYDASATSERELALLISDHEARYAELAEFWQTTPGHRFRSFVYRDHDQKGAMMGGRRTLVAKIWLGEMHITWDGVGDELLAHEMAHLFLRDDGYGPLRLASGNGLLPIMALVEGAATAAAWGADDLDYHYWSAAIHRLELGEDISELLGPAGFWSRYSRRAYTLTGSFARWLIDTEGPAAFRAAYRRGDFESAYGRPLPALTAEWREFLDALPVSDAQMEVARLRYDRPSLFGKRCARELATRFDDGDDALRSGDFVHASRCYESILEDDPTNVAYRLQIARRYLEMGDFEDAERHATMVAEADGAGRARQDAALELLADLAWMRGEFDVAAAGYATTIEAVGTAGDRRRLAAKADALASREAAPRTAEAVRRVLVERPSPPSTSVIAELVVAAQRENSSLAAYLATLQVAARDASPVVADLASNIPRGDLRPEQAERLDEVVARTLALQGDPRACEAWERVSTTAEPGSERASTAAMWLGRCRRGTLPPPVNPG